jgi:signal peptidase II
VNNSNAKSLWLTALFVISDQATKIYVKYSMELDQSISILGKYIQFQYIKNPGMVFGIPIGSKLFYKFYTTIACIIITVLLFRLRKEQFWMRIALASILGGAIGNLIDRFVFGEVIDFIQIGSWPIFNIADVALTFGMTVLLIVVFFDKKSNKEYEQ